MGVSGSSGPLVPETPTRFFLGLEEVAQPARVLFESAGADPPGLDRGLNPGCDDSATSKLAGCLEN